MKTQYIESKLEEKLSSLGIGGVSMQDIKKIIKCSELVSVDKNNIFREECFNENIHLILKGSFRHVNKGEIYNEEILRFSFPNDIIFSFPYGDYTHEIIANTKCLILRIPTKEMAAHGGDKYSEFMDKLKTRALKIMDREIVFRKMRPEDIYEQMLNVWGNDWSDINKKYVAGYLAISVQHLQRLLKKNINNFACKAL